VAYDAVAFLQGHSGHLQTGGHEGYGCALKDMPEIMHAGCFAHAGRKPFEAAKANNKDRSAQEGLKYTRSLCQVEDAMRSRRKKDNGNERFLRDRKSETEPVLKQFKGWVEKLEGQAPPSLLSGKQWNKPAMYFESPYLTPGNSACENATRPYSFQVSCSPF
jgi:transposase